MDKNFLNSQQLDVIFQTEDTNDSWSSFDGETETRKFLEAVLKLPGAAGMQTLTVTNNAIIPFVARNLVTLPSGVTSGVITDILFDNTHVGMEIWLQSADASKTISFQEGGSIAPIDVGAGTFSLGANYWIHLKREASVWKVIGSETIAPQGDQLRVDGTTITESNRVATAINIDLGDGSTAISRGQIGNATIQIGGLDLNNFKNAGIYFWDTAGIPANSPIIGVGIGVYVYAWGTNSTRQFVFDLTRSAPNAYVRQFSAGIWGNWFRTDTTLLTQNVTGLIEDLELLSNDVSGIKSESIAKWVTLNNVENSVNNIIPRVTTAENSIASYGTRITALEEAPAGGGGDVTTGQLDAVKTRVTNLEDTRVKTTDMTAAINTAVSPLATTVALNAVSTVANAAVPTTRTITTTAPLSGGGNLSANRTLSVSTGTSSAVGVLQLATTAEATTGINTAKAITAAGLAAHVTSKISTLAAAADLTTTNTNVTNLTARVTTAEGNITSHGTRITALEAGGGGSGGGDVTTAQLDAVKTDVAANKTSIAGHETRIAAVETPILDGNNVEANLIFFGVDAEQAQATGANVDGATITIPEMADAAMALFFNGSQTHGRLSALERETDELLTSLGSIDTALNAIIGETI